MIRLENISKSYGGNVVFSNFSMELRDEVMTRS